MTESELDEVTHPELFFGLVGPIGVDMDDVQEKLSEALRQVGYDSRLIYITKILEKYEVPTEKSPDVTVLGHKIGNANKFCRTVGRGDALAALAILEINSGRPEKTELNSDGKGVTIKLARPKMAYIIRQLKRVAEVDLLRKVYGDNFIQVSVSLGKDARIQNIINRISIDQPALKHQECERHARALIEIDEHQDNDTFGQEAGDIFHRGDFFVNATDSRKLAVNLLGFIRALFGDNTMSPNRDEFGSYLAATAALRSVDLSRQVGSSILTKEGDVITLGCNEVPKPGGGNYWFDDQERMRDIERGGEQNSIEKQRIIVDFVQNLQAAGIINDSQDFSTDQMKSKLSSASDQALISDITEYGRMTHAEMSAICDAARLGRSVLGATIYVTTFPCHNCAKHIIASGIERVVYIEPYPKSRALTSHTDAISVEGTGSHKVAFSHFEGIAPSRYREIFKKNKRRIGQKILTWYEGEPRPRINPRVNFHVSREQVASNLVLSVLSQKPKD